MPRYLIDFTPLRRLRAHGRTSYYLRLWGAIRHRERRQRAEPSAAVLPRVLALLAADQVADRYDRPGPPLHAARALTAPQPPRR